MPLTEGSTQRWRRTGAPESRRWAPAPRKLLDRGSLPWLWPGGGCFAADTTAYLGSPCSRTADWPCLEAPWNSFHSSPSFCKTDQGWTWRTEQVALRRIEVSCWSERTWTGKRLLGSRGRGESRWGVEREGWRCTGQGNPTLSIVVQRGKRKEVAAKPGDCLQRVGNRSVQMTSMSPDWDTERQAWNFPSFPSSTSSSPSFTLSCFNGGWGNGAEDKMVLSPPLWSASEEGWERKWKDGEQRSDTVMGLEKD